MRKIGRRGREYIKWRDEIAIPYLDKTSGHSCNCCGVGGKLDVAHKLKRGSHPHLKMSLENIEWKCRNCHLKEHL